MSHITISSLAADGAVTQYADILFLSFPGGERHVRLPAEQLENASATNWCVTATVFTPADIMDLLLTTDALRRLVQPGSTLRLVMPYVPYARQDRVALEGEPLSAAVFCALINSMHFDVVEVWDPHSDVTPALLKNVRIRSTKELMQSTFAEQGLEGLLRGCAFVAPDAGARKRVASLAKAFDVEAVFADKVRDVRTGKLSGAQVMGAVPAKPLLVVDDICDGGGTFLELAKVLREKTSQPLYLYVTHGLFTKGLDSLKEHYDGVFAANCRTDDVKAQLGLFHRLGLAA